MELKKPTKKKIISIIVPCYNEEDVLELFIKELDSMIEIMSSYDFEVLFINDGSKDNTINLLRRFNDENDKFKYISFSRNFGKEAAMFAGLKNVKGDFVTIMDADLQHPPKFLIEMMKYVESGYDSVATRRISRKGEPIIRSFFSKTFYRLMNRLSDIELVDGACDFRVMNRKMVDSILEIKEYHRFTKGIYNWVGFKTKWLEFENIERPVGDTKWSFRSLFSYAIEGVVSFSTVPLRFASIIGGIVSMLSLIYTFYILGKTILLGIDIPGYASLICVIMFIGGIQLLALGVIGEYVSRIYMETKKRPVYIIDEIYSERNTKIVPKNIEIVAKDIEKEKKFYRDIIELQNEG